MASSPRVVSLVGKALVIVAVMTGLPRPVLAAPFFLESLVEANLGCHFTTDPSTNECLNEEDPLDVQVFGVEGGLITHSFGSAFVDSFSSAEARFGQLKVTAAAAFDLPSPDTRFVTANAQSLDELTISGEGIPTGTPGSLDVTFELSGVIASAGSGGAAALVGIQWDGPQGGGDFFNIYTSSTSGPVTVRVPIVYGEAFLLSYYLGAA
ncbi:MAG: hypothetical protein ABIS29_08950, partial [Vicinamibacterales bacterium]